MSFYSWAKNNQNKSQELNELFKTIEKNVDVWQSVGSLDQARQAIVNDLGLNDSDKKRVSESFDGLWSEFLARPSEKGDATPDGKSKPLLAIIENNSTTLIVGILALAFIIYLVNTITQTDPGGDPNTGFLAQLADPAVARGLVTFLFAIGTVVVALILTAAAFVINGENREEMNERFDMGKQVLTALIGIFGTILGFYFGSLGVETPSDQEQKPAVQQENADVEQAGGDGAAGQPVPAQPSGGDDGGDN